MIDEIEKSAEEFKNSIGSFGTYNPMEIYDIIDQYIKKLEVFKHSCTNDIVKMKKEEHYKILLEKKNLGIK